MSDKTPTPGENKPERIAKRIARSGVCSRRDAERMIDEGLVKLNGKVLDSPAVTVTNEDEIYVNGKPLPEKEKPRLWRLFKKRGLVTSHRDEQGRDTVFEHLPSYVPRVISVGRLDLNSEGLLLLTNDGELARYLELPATGWARRYRVRVHGRIEESKLKQLEEGVTVDGVHYGSIHAEVDVQKDSNAWMTVTLREGKNREIRRVMEHLGWPVTRLMRVSYGPFQLGSLAPGDCEEITGKVMKEQLAAFFKGDYSKVSEKKSVARGGTSRPKAPRTVFGQPAQRKRQQGGPAQNPNANTNGTDDDPRDSRAGRPSLGRPGAGRSYGRPLDRSEGDRNEADRDGGNDRRGNDAPRGGASRDDKRSASSRSEKPRIGAAPRPGGRGKPAASNARPERDDRDDRNDRSSGRPTDKGRGRYAPGGASGSDKPGRGRFAGSDARDGRGRDDARDGRGRDGGRDGGRNSGRDGFGRDGARDSGGRDSGGRDGGNRNSGSRGTGPRGSTGGRSSNARDGGRDSAGRDSGGRDAGNRDGGSRGTGARGTGPRGSTTRDGGRDTGRGGSRDSARDSGRRDGAGFAGGRGKPGGKPAGRSGNSTSTPGRKPAGNRPRGKKD
ncbi:pseudouridine synthase [Thalassospira lohafexi]|uniref:Pseudouridine synthase n=1 Tax=Thalassospira lohafexi TaxID=744227 RepID=A0A2N3L5H0_9PROT|nr:RNA-binding protein [Thalassospira lohafexi]